jgi:hypothetical protein
LITKEQWAEIEKDLAGYFGSKDFYLGKDKISVVREAWKEGERRLIVYFNGSLRPAWTHKQDNKNYNPLVEKFWCKKSRAKWRAKFRASMTKIYGKKRVLQECPDLGEKLIFYVPFFAKAKALVTQFKKITGLELIEPESKSQEASMV